VAADEELPVVRVRVSVNVDSLRRGWEGEVELTPRIQTLVRAGYLTILGHVWSPPPAAVDVAAPATPPVAEASPVANRSRTRAPRKADGDGGESPDPA
jgi:hypothetical protein